MTKKELMVIIGIVFLAVIILFVVNKNKIKKKSEENQTQNLVRTEYNDEEEKYVVYDETGTEIYNGTNRAEVEFRERHPDFNPGFEDLDQNMVLTEMVEN